jgi:hypothetical protein
MNDIFVSCSISSNRRKEKEAMSTSTTTAAEPKEAKDPRKKPPNPIKRFRLKQRIQFLEQQNRELSNHIHNLLLEMEKLKTDRNQWKAYAEDPAMYEIFSKASVDQFLATHWKSR